MKTQANFTKVYINNEGKLTSSPVRWEKDEEGKPKLVDNTPALDDIGRQKIAPLNRRARRAMKSKKWGGPVL